MKKYTIKIEIVVVAPEDLADDVADLLRRARFMRQRSQCHYSGYAVGAVVRSANGNVYEGCNVERCTYTQTTHAEENAIDTMVAAEGPSAKISVLALAAAPQKVAVPSEPLVWPPPDEPDFSAVPCGQCLQVIWENCHGDGAVKLYCQSAQGLVTIMTIADAFPVKFDLPE